MGVRGSGEWLGVDIGEPETILQLIVIGWNNLPGDSAGLGGCPWGTILQLVVIGWKAELPWEPKVTLSLVLGRVGVRSPAARFGVNAPADAPISALLKPFSLMGSCEMGELEGARVEVRDAPEMGLDALGAILGDEG